MAATYYTKDHEYIVVDGDVGVVGITDFAQGQLGDVVFVELPEIGAQRKKGDATAVVESVKAASEVYAPLGGEIVAINDGLVDNPALVNAEAEGGGWFFKIRIADSGELASLLDAAGYKALLASLA
jgi:glycine cleavage system H protein